MFARTALALCLLFPLAIVSPARAGSYPTPIRIDAGPLDHALKEIARQTGGELLFDRNLVAGLQARPINTKATAMTAIQAALAGTNLSVRRTASGALIIEPPAPAPLARQDVAVAEVLVIGHRTQNADIRRQETDIQPYRVTTAAQVTDAHVDDLGQYFDTHLPTNANAAPSLGLTETPGGTNSRIDLRGLGPDETLVLIDGRRMPSFPGGVASLLPFGPQQELDFAQPDLNALQLHAIDRVESLTGTAGGIYGYGALGGVINVVLAHDRPGAELHMTTGLSSRGDAGRASFEARVEFSPDHGATDVTLYAGLTRSQPLTAGQRDYAERDARTTYQVAPSQFIGLTDPHGNAVGVFDAFGVENLTLKPEYGGASLGSPFTVLPSSFNGTPQQAAAALLGRAGQLNLGLSDGAAASDLAPNPELGSLLVNVRHQFSGGVEAYFDGIMLWNHGRDVAHDVNGEILLDPSSPYNPFNQYIIASFPLRSSLDSRTRFDSSRFTIGLVAPIPFGWRATAEATWGGAQYYQAQIDRYEDPTAILLGDVNPFAGWSQFQAALRPYQVSGAYQFTANTRYLEQSLRLAGPVFHTAGGPATLTVLAEQRSEDVPGYSVSITGDDPQLAGFYRGPVAPESTTTTSVYAELRSRVFADTAPLPLLRDLEVQLAVRDDTQSYDFSTAPLQPGAPRMHANFSGASYTVGAKVSPLRWLMLRGSFATGQTPPPVEDLISTVDPDNFDFFIDPKRGGQEELDFYTQRTAGSPHLKNLLASTASVGLVLTPLGSRSLQFSLDYSHISKTHDVEFLDDRTVIAHEDNWPQRVQRAPLTDEDRALGYTAGSIIGIDSTAINGGRTDVETLDGRFEWSFALPVGWLHLYGSATYNLSNVQKGLFQPGVQLDGYLGGPLTWRANGGADWSLGSLILGVNVQYYGGYRVSLVGEPGDTYAETFQGSDSIPAQTYVDLHVGKRLRLKNTDFRIDFGVSDVFDTAPPRVSAWVNFGPGYSAYGDPRRRRFELSISAAF